MKTHSCSGKERGALAARTLVKTPPEAPPEDPEAGVRIRANGESYAVRPGETIAGFLERLGLAGRRIAVERNREIVPRGAFARETLAEGDELEIVHFVGGG